MLISKIVWATSLALGVKASLDHCDGPRRDEHCPPDTAFAEARSFNFATTSLEDARRLWSVDDTDQHGDEKGIAALGRDDKGILLAIKKQGEGTALSSNRYLLFGKTTVEVQGAPGPGLITAIGLRSDTGNRILWEILGANDHQVQTNYFYDDEPVYNTYNYTYPTQLPVTDQFHNYTIQWTDKTLAFSIDGEHRKTMTLDEDLSAEIWPQVPMHIFLRIWTVNGNDDPGRVAWAGGLPQWGHSPFAAYVRRVEIEDYAGYCKTIHNGPVTYDYDANLTGWEDIHVQGCQETSSLDGTHENHVPTKNVTDFLVPTKTSGDGSHSSLPSSTNGSAPPKSDDNEDGVVQIGPGRSRSYLVTLAICLAFML
ncbi:hydrolase family 16 [Geosmithia morbida]|uniref:Hydrolase family 16 n=1 Tax=Geosmithia morbida TaxID=1094350 RepID=A0A9P4Z0X1_9HYPO|nr:hydrolase family 16 [Geosmithia morbida]KAF4126087.1 hydrolase family 16 [Geosmithia morbida]